MTENERTQSQREGHQDQENKASSPHAPQSGREEGRNQRPADAGVVLRRSPDPHAPGSWRVAPLRPLHPSNVDTKEASDRRQSPSNVDTRNEDQRTRTSSNVDIEDNEYQNPKQKKFATPDQSRKAMGSRPNVDTDDEFQNMPTFKKHDDPVLTKLRDFGASKKTGPSGPNMEVVRKLREATKKRIVDKAKANGRDPSAGSVAVSHGLTRSEKTHNHYLERGQSMVRRFQKETGREYGSFLHLDPLEFVNWFFSLKSTVKSSTWRPYRQSVKAIISSIPHDNTEAAMGLIDSDIVEIEMTDQPLPVSKIDSNFEGDRKKLPRKTSALKEKRFPKSDFDKVISYLKYFSRSKLSTVLVDWMIAGIATGLRPIEWGTTDLEIREDETVASGRRVWLYVLNAKSTNGRANGLVRTIDISNFSDDTLIAIRRMSENGSNWLVDDEYNMYQSQVAQLLYVTCQKLFPGRKRIYSLYSLRHQFIANAKSYQKPEEISAIVGHGVTATASENYGKKRSSWGPDEIPEKPVAIAEEVATVKQSLEFFNNRHKLQVAAGLVKPDKSFSIED